MFTGKGCCFEGQLCRCWTLLESCFTIIINISHALIVNRICDFNFRKFFKETRTTQVCFTSFWLLIDTIIVTFLLKASYVIILNKIIVNHFIMYCWLEWILIQLVLLQFLLLSIIGYYTVFDSDRYWSPFIIIHMILNLFDGRNLIIWTCLIWNHNVSVYSGLEYCCAKN